LRKARIVFGFFMLGLCAISMMAAQADFSGTWVLDMQKTRSLPKSLKGLTMVVTQNGQQLVVQRQMNGSGGRETIGLSMVMPQATYSLDGEEKAVQFAGMNLKIKAKWAKDGETLDLSVIQENNMSTQTPGFHVKERWTLSDGGQVLKVQRSVTTGGGTGMITLIFGKGASGAPPQ